MKSSSNHRLEKRREERFSVLQCSILSVSDADAGQDPPRMSHGHSVQAAVTEEAVQSEMFLHGNISK